MCYTGIGRRCMRAKKSTSGKAPVKGLGRAAPGLPKKRKAAVDAAAETGGANEVTEGSDPAAAPQRPAKKARKKPSAGPTIDLASSLRIKSEAEASGMHRPPVASAAPKGKKKVGFDNPEARCGCLQRQCCHVQTSKALALWACGACHCMGAPAVL